MRMEQIDLIDILLFIFQNQINQAWSDMDFERVAQFLSQEYNVIDTLRDIGFVDKATSKTKQHYKEMRKFYEMVQTWEPNGINHAYLTYTEAINTRKK